MEIRDSLPSLFIGSSSEGLKVAEYLQQALEGHCEATISSQGVFGLSQSPLEGLVAACKRSDFAAFILTPSDMATQQDGLQQTIRENVLFEVGFFMGSLGRDRTFIVTCQDDKVDLPSDLAGIVLAKYRRYESGNIAAAISPVALKIREAIKKIRNSDNPQTSFQNMLREFVKYIDLMNELKRAHNMLQELAIPLDSLVTGFRIFPAWREEPPTSEAAQGIRAGWGAVQKRFYVVEYFALEMKSSEARSLFNLLTQIKNDFVAVLEGSKPVRLYDLSLQLYEQCQVKLEIIDKLMLNQFQHIDRVIDQISRSINNDST